MPWSKIGTNFDPDEETANFGPRLAVESSGKIFDVLTHATVSPSQGSKAGDSDTNELQWVLSRSRRSPDKFALVLDTYLHVFGTDFQDVFSIDFKSIIDVIEWTSNDNFLICALRSGQVQFVHIPSRHPLPALQVTEGTENHYGKTFAGIIGKESSSFILLMASGLIKSFQSTSLDLIDNALKSEDIATLKE